MSLNKNSALGVKPYVTELSLSRSLALTQTLGFCDVEQLERHFSNIYSRMSGWGRRPRSQKRNRQLTGGGREVISREEVFGKSSTGNHFLSLVFRRIGHRVCRSPLVARFFRFILKIQQSPRMVHKFSCLKPKALISLRACQVLTTIIPQSVI
ncbi:hypothetical protein L873DRAFT_754666 [Choiromyces venosus 120613-1]|uniref:Uncharacterized protein n=1 Tax=Choiromyces venosus 120613-1 TaxID=1336337 RepID=A0A3N4IW17_9PEZI|nr:hypothetical protein L873DRAFT_754666 [Choiromyces venosus 120613-1]